MHYVYKLVDPRNSEVRYIGMTNDPHMRYLHHLQRSDGLQAKGSWIRELSETGLNPHMDIIESHEDRGIAYEREKYWIFTYRQEGARLLNVHHGFVAPSKHKISFAHVLACYDNEKVRKKVMCGLEALEPVRIEKKDKYNIQDLFKHLPITIQQVSALLDIPEYASIRFVAGKETGLYRVRLWLAFFSWIYQMSIPLTSISGIAIKDEDAIAAAIAHHTRTGYLSTDHPSF